MGIFKPKAKSKMESSPSLATAFNTKRATGKKPHYAKGGQIPETEETSYAEGGEVETGNCPHCAGTGYFDDNMEGPATDISHNVHAKQETTDYQGEKVTVDNQIGDEREEESGDKFDRIGKIMSKMKR